MSSLKEAEITLSNKENVIRTLKNENSELIKELQKKDDDISEIAENFNLKIETINNRVKILEKEKDILFKEKEEDHKEILNLRNKLNDSQGLYNKKVSTMEKSKDYSFEMHKKELSSKFQSKEDDYLHEISRLQNIILDRDKERESLKLKYDKKCHSVKYFNLDET